LGDTVAIGLAIVVHAKENRVVGGIRIKDRAELPTDVVMARHLPILKQQYQRLVIRAQAKISNAQYRNERGPGFARALHDGGG